MPKYLVFRDTPVLAHGHGGGGGRVILRDYARCLTNVVDYVKNDVHGCAHYFLIKILPMCEGVVYSPLPHRCICVYIETLSIASLGIGLINVRNELQSPKTV